MLIASIDIRNGRAVQLRQGKDLVLESDKDPIHLAKEFSRYGEVAVIDLDAALGTGNNRELIKKICRVAELRVGGGIRDLETGRDYLRAGARKIIIGTSAEPDFLKDFPLDSVIVALDQKKGEVFDRGWQNATGENFLERACRLADYCSGFLLTFIEEEGGMGGMNCELVRDLSKLMPKPLTVAGGISSSREIVEISRMGVDVQVGMALYTGRIDLAETVVASVNFSKEGLVPTIVQDEHGQVLMLAYSNSESLRRALEEGKGIYFSRSRKEIWEKGLSSGASQKLLSCRLDCDRDSLLFKVSQKKSACHAGSYSCFGSSSPQKDFTVKTLYEVLKERRAKALPASYSQSLFSDRKKLMAKIAEESQEVINYSSIENLRWEIADLLYMLSVLAVDEGIEWKDLEAELAGRRK